MCGIWVVYQPPVAAHITWIIGQCLLYLSKKQGIAPIFSSSWGNIADHLLSRLYQTKQR
jgi:hypothetical protein